MLLILTSCKVNLDVKVKKFIDKNCKCDVDKCECVDLYNKDNRIFINCTGIEIDSLIDMLKGCQYYNIINDVKWEKT